MPRRRQPVLYRRLFIALTVFGLFVLFDLALFGWLIFRSLSQRELETALAETEVHAEELARRIVGRAEEEGGDLYMAIATERETQTYIDSVLMEREIVNTLEIRDREGRLVYRSKREREIPEDTAAAGEVEGWDPELPHIPVGEGEGRVEVSPTRVEVFPADLPDIQVAIGELGVLEIGLSPAELGERIAVLRQDLIRQTSATGAVTLLLLLTAYLAIWLLLRRARRLEEQAEEAERLAYIGTLASGLAHEIRNPLNSLNLNMQMLEEEMEESDRGAGSGRRLLAITRSELTRLERLVTDFLTYARPRPLELEEVDPGELLRRVEEVLAGEVRRREVRLEVKDASAGARVRVDVERMKQLLLNLAHNALAATEETGRPPRLTLAARRRGGQLVVEVRDNGTGIPAEEKEHIFDLFYSTRKGGTGLGLAIVRRIAEAHGGRVEVESTPGVGTAVSVHLPVSSLAESAATPATVLEDAVPARPPSRA